MSQFDDNNLKSFLKDNHPVAPEPAADELKTLLRRLDLDSGPVKVVGRADRSRKSWFLFAGSAMAAGLAAAFWMQVQQPIDADAGRIGSEAAMVAGTPSGDDFSDDEEELPSIDVGEEYLGLIASMAE